MILNIFGKCKDIFIDTLNKLKGSDRRVALASVSKVIGKGGQTFVAQEFNVSRDTIRKGLHELNSGITVVDAFNARGRKKIEEKLPNLLRDIKDIVDSQSQTDPNFKTTRIFTRLTVKEVRNQLIKQKGYTDKELPTNQTFNNKISGSPDGKDTLLLNADNGSENSSRRTQFIKRMIAFSAKHNVKIILVYYPPYHSKYNLIERVWGRLEQHWNGDLLDTKEAVLGFARSMIPYRQATDAEEIRLPDNQTKFQFLIGRLQTVFKRYNYKLNTLCFNSS